MTMRPADLYAYMLSLLLVVAVTAILFVLNPVLGFSRISIVYLIPVMISATRWGTVPAVITAVAAVACADFFFYPPLYTFNIDDPQNILDLALFVLVAIVTGYLATNLRRQVEIARRHEADLRELYDFSRQLARCDTAVDIYAAIEEHLSRTIRRRTVLIGIGRGNRPESTAGPAALPDLVRREAAAIATQRGAGPDTVVDPGAGDLWLIRPVSAKTPDFGMVAIDLGNESRDAVAAITRRVEAVLAEAATTLERLDVARALNDARVRAETDQLREALIGSVSHELRTPLASILGAASVVAGAPSIVEDPRLAALAELIHDEAEHLNGDIQNLLDATRITAQGVQPKREWVDPTDIVNAAVDRRHRRLMNHKVDFNLEPDLPFLHVDPVLLEQAFGQALGNAAKYSPRGSTIRVRAYRRNGEVVLSVADQGAGLTADEQGRLGERSFRGRRHQLSIPGSGLGVWIAQTFVTANGGRIESSSEGEGRGTTIAMSFPVPDFEDPPPADDDNE
jgi:two-component system sensor histidine kinase KdpD